jgi:NAD(P)-dependent dehydrogenase (short-subunit alcohol dehydrogenase family)
MGTLEGRTALVTGAAGGIGREIVRGLLSVGGKVMAADLSKDRLAALAEEHGGAAKGRLATLALDIGAYDACAAAVAETVRKFGSLDILVNNAGIGMSSIREDHMTRLISVEEIAPQVWDRFVAVNLSGAWYLTRAAVPGMKERRWGRIITVTTSFFTMLRGRFHPYGPTKAGLEAMSAGHAKEFDGTGITVNVVVPGGPADTPMVPASSGMKRSELIPPTKMVPPLLWLCSRDADAVTGKRYVAAKWDAKLAVAAARAACEAPIAWPELAAAPVWPGGNPDAGP